MVERGGKVREPAKLLRRLSSSAVTGCCGCDNADRKRVRFASRP